MAIMVPDMSFQRSNIRSFIFQEHLHAMYNGHVEVTKTWKRVQVNMWLP